MLLLILAFAFLYLLVLAWLWASDMMRSTASIKKSSRKQPNPPPCLCRTQWFFSVRTYTQLDRCGCSKNVFIPHAKKNT